MFTQTPIVRAVRQQGAAHPVVPTFEAWGTAWSSACTGIQCEGLKPYFWNSIFIAIPAVFISTLIGALNGYVVD